MHDIGKSSQYFQEKLRTINTISKDPIRHEWLSLMLVPHIRNNKTLSEAYTLLKPIINNDNKPSWLKKGINDALEASDFVIATHHKLFAPVDKDTSPEASNHVRNADRQSQQSSSFV